MKIWRCDPTGLGAHRHRTVGGVGFLICRESYVWPLFRPRRKAEGNNLYENYHKVSVSLNLEGRLYSHFRSSSSFSPRPLPFAFAIIYAVASTSSFSGIFYQHVRLEHGKKTEHFIYMSIGSAMRYRRGALIIPMFNGSQLPKRSHYTTKTARLYSLGNF